MDAKEEIRQWALVKPIGHYRRTCPICSESRVHHRKSECLSISVEDTKACWQCWHCGDAGAVRLADKMPSILRPAPPVSNAVKKMHDTISGGSKSFLTSRGISAETAILFGITEAIAYFPELKRETPAIAFPYYEKDKLWGHKLRSLDEKAHVCSRGLKTFFGSHLLDVVEDHRIIICEGELDALSIYMAKVMNAISVPNGASSFGASDAKDTLLWSIKAEIDKTERIVIATDNDEPGEKLGEELARRIGRHRCWKVIYPEGCKDANDVLMQYGHEALAEAIEKAIPWPIAGLYEAERFFEEVDHLHKNGFADKVKTGMGVVDEIYSVGNGLLTVVTGIPGHGKSTFVDQLMINLARTKDYSSIICSFEKPPSVHIGQLSEMLLHKQFFKRDIGGERMTERELHSTYGFINEHFKFMYQDDGAKASIDSIIDRIKTAVFRWGVQCAVIDPFNYIERPKEAENETQFIDDILTKLRLLASAHDLHIWFVAHPTKIPMDHEGNYQPPKGYSISGSAAWYSKADFGLTIHKQDKRSGEVRVINWKTRFNWLGKEGECTVLYDQTRNVYISDMLSDLLPMEFGQ